MKNVKGGRQARGDAPESTGVSSRGTGGKRDRRTDGMKNGLVGGQDRRKNWGEGRQREQG